ncbi:unnamed protein product [Clonostachys rosea f. rosea IK726]|uniref:Uncharacterized protein n=1 Tax=Clonostachys rosea f. rosea IK726 TaxID=1349383 RepID=A0ACA9UC81_BIOOC|nr:unnamed protein product [Clonostachys rosea f. rosea IK726]
MPQLHQVAEPYVPDGRILSELRALAQSTRWWVAWCRDFSNTPKLTSALNTALDGLVKFACEPEALRKRQTAYPTIISHSTTGQRSYSNEVMDYSTFFLEAMGPSEWMKGSIGPAGRQELEETLWNEAEEKFRLVQDMATPREHHLDLTRPDEDILVANCETMMRDLPTSFRMVDLGTGGLDKIVTLLREVVKQRKSCYYLAIDVSLKTLNKQVALKKLFRDHPKIQIRGYQADIGSAHRFLAKLPGPIRFLSLGSVLLNDMNPASRLKPYSQLLRRRPGSSLHISQDASTAVDRAELMEAYGQQEFMDFIRQRLCHLHGFNPEDWELDYSLDDGPPFHHVFILKGKDIRAGEEHRFFPSCKPDIETIKSISSSQGLSIYEIYENPGSRMSESVP